MFVLKVIIIASLLGYPNKEAKLNRVFFKKIYAESSKKFTLYKKFLTISS